MTDSQPHRRRRRWRLWREKDWLGTAGDGPLPPEPETLRAGETVILGDGTFAIVLDAGDPVRVRTVGVDARVLEVAADEVGPYPGITMVLTAARSAETALRRRAQDALTHLGITAASDPHPDPVWAAARLMLLLPGPAALRLMQVTSPPMWVEVAETPDLLGKITSDLMRVRALTREESNLINRAQGRRGTLWRVDRDGVAATVAAVRCRKRRHIVGTDCVVTLGPGSSEAELRAAFDWHRAAGTCAVVATIYPESVTDTDPRVTAAVDRFLGGDADIILINNDAPASPK